MADTTQKIYGNPNTKPSLYSLQPNDFLSQSRKERIEIAKTTKTALQRFMDEFPEDYEAVKMAQHTTAGHIATKWPPTKSSKPLPLNAGTFVHILPCDPLEAAFCVSADKEAFGRIGVVNPADPRSPDGWFKNGDNTVETSLNLRSLLSLTVKPEWHKPLRFDPAGLAFVHGIRVFALQAGHQLPDKDHFKVTFLTSPIPVVPELQASKVDGKETQVYKNDTARKALRAKVYNLLQLACIMKINTLVMSPLGCEDHFGHPYEEVAAVMRDVLLGADGSNPGGFRKVGLHYVCIAISSADKSGQFDQSESLRTTFVNTFSNSPHVTVDHGNTRYLKAILEKSQG